MPFIVEGIVTSLDVKDELNIAPMGPTVDTHFKRMTLRPFPTSTTYHNLSERGFGVFHITDDVELLAKTAVGELDSVPDTVSAQTLPGRILADACRWFEFHVETIDHSSERIELSCRVVYEGRIRDFVGFNRAKNAVVEAAILATRLHLLGPEIIAEEFKRLAIIVDKTGGESEHRAFEFLKRHIAKS